VSGHFRTNAWTHFGTTAERRYRQCEGLQSGNDLQGHSRSSLLHRGSGVTQGHRQCHQSIERIPFPIPYSTLIETIRLSFSSYSELFCQKSHILTYPACIWPMSIVATGKWLAESSCHLVRRYRPYPGPHCARWGDPTPPSQKKGHSSPPLFGPCLLRPNGRPSQQLLSSCAKWIHTAVFDHATYRYSQLAGATSPRGRASLMRRRIAWRCFVGWGFVYQSAATRCLLGGCRPV